jgi:MFS family permease
VLLLLALIVGMSFLGLGFIMPLRALYGREIGASSVEIGLMAASFLLAGFLAAPLMGMLTDRCGAANVLWVGVLLHGGLVLAYIPARDPLLLIGLRALEGIAAAAVLPPARALVNALGPRHRQAEALGVIGAAQMAGMLLGPAAGAFLASATTYDLAFVVASIPLILGAVAARLLLPRHDLSPATEVGQGWARPDKTRLAPTQPLPSSYEATASARGGKTAAPATAPALASPLPAREKGQGMRSLFARPLLLTYTLQLLLGLSGGVVMAVWSLYMADRGSSLFLIGLSYTTYALPSMVLTPLLGRLSDRYGRYRPVVGGLFCFGGVFAVYALPLTPWAIVFIGMLEGIASSLVGSAVGGLLADVTPAGVRGRVQANFSAAGTLGSLISATGAGALYTLAPGVPFLAVGLTYIAASLVLLAPALARLFPAAHVAGGSHETLAAFEAVETLEPFEECSSVPRS